MSVFNFHLRPWVGTGTGRSGVVGGRAGSPLGLYLELKVPTLHSQPAPGMKLLAGSQPLGGLGTSPASQLKMVMLVLLVVNPSLGCLTRSGQDSERVASKQGKEPEYHPQVELAEKGENHFKLNLV